MGFYKLIDGKVVHIRSKPKAETEKSEPQKKEVKSNG
jgi:hypothetical protein